MNGKPHRRRIGARPFNAVAHMSLYDDMIAWPKVSILRLAFKTQASGAREHRNPFVPGLVVPEARRTGLPGRDDPLDPHSRPGKDLRNDFFRSIRRRYFGKKVGA